VELFVKPAKELVRDNIKPYVPQGPGVLDQFKDLAKEVFNNLKDTYLNKQGVYVQDL
jgi:hypothetical protein